MNNARRKFKLGMHSYTLHLSGCGESWGFQSSGEIHAFERVLTLDKLMEFAVQEGIDVLHITLVDLDNDTSPEHLGPCQGAVRAVGRRAGAERLLQRPL